MDQPVTPAIFAGVVRKVIASMQLVFTEPAEIATVGFTSECTPA